MTYQSRTARLKGISEHIGREFPRATDLYQFEQALKVEGRSLRVGGG